MRSDQHPDATHVLGESQGFNPLPVKIARENVPGFGEVTTAESMWVPTLPEVLELLRGGRICLNIMGGQPPVRLTVAPAEPGNQDRLAELPQEFAAELRSALRAIEDSLANLDQQFALAPGAPVAGNA